MDKVTETPSVASTGNARPMVSGAAPGCAIRPVLFSGPMVRAILAGEKTQTRRVIKPQPPAHHWKTLPGYKRRISLLERNDGRIHARFQDSIPQNIDYPVWRKCPYGKPGDRLWVRETWWECVNNNDRLYYAATETPETTDRRHYKKRPSIFMPRTASRITLEITGIRVERLQDIGDADAHAEGCTTPATAARSHFRNLWESINGLKSWDDNPYVWVVKFRVV